MRNFLHAIYQSLLGFHASYFLNPLLMTYSVQLMYFLATLPTLL